MNSDRNAFDGWRFLRRIEALHANKDSFLREMNAFQQAASEEKLQTARGLISIACEPDESMLNRIKALSYLAPVLGCCQGSNLDEFEFRLSFLAMQASRGPASLANSAERHPDEGCASVQGNADWFCCLSVICIIAINREIGLSCIDRILANGPQEKLRRNLNEIRHRSGIG